MMPFDGGDDFIVRSANYAANLETATSIPAPPAIPDPEGELIPEEFHTPNIKTIAELAAFSGLPGDLAHQEPGPGSARRQAR